MSVTGFDHAAIPTDDAERLITLSMRLGFRLDARLAPLERAGVATIAGPVPRVGGRAGGTGAGVSVDTRDPDDVARSPRASA